MGPYRFQFLAGSRLSLICLTITGLIVLVGFHPSIVVEARPNEYIMHASLSNADASITGDERSYFVGESVADAGDVNNDGLNDILFSSRWPDNQVYLILGRNTSWEKKSTVETVDASFHFDGMTRDKVEVVGAGDVNGDGYDDFLAGSNRKSNSDNNIYLVFGKRDGWKINTPLPYTNASFFEDSPTATYRFFSGVGDVNGDGYDDIVIVGTKFYLIFGKSDGWSMDTNVSGANVTILPEVMHNNADDSYRISDVNDVNGDGLDDILISDFRIDNQRGKSYLIFGRKVQPQKDENFTDAYGRSLGWPKELKITDANSSFIGESVDDFSGVSISGAGDVNGDGYNEILIGARFNNDGGRNAGKTYLIFGKSAGWKMNNSLSNSNASFIGEKEHDNSGYTISGGEDVNGDGFDDILISAPRNDIIDRMVGHTYLIFGKPSDWTNDQLLSESDGSFIGETRKDLSGLAATLIGDCNGDNLADIVITAPGFGGVEEEIGKVYLIFNPIGREIVPIDNFIVLSSLGIVLIVLLILIYFIARGNGRGKN